ncbi:helix-turn-helix domain-containing protein [Mucilaginibacter ginsenosidivorax]|uniref:Helix-turn-helix transcriptional regulator n=1 Tax=Mucilaginibacter ginsenosidivorax TaxID=862126 RepID=A0A5B8W5B2_9SPHI|nr:helix-turn-helix transcriptional regulator [Mucilaginibacter ginsenosidivorax]QEC78861.1 helix-turn-helix transcriptional regulator [Mucilaginibacter ginsenosidivorax]
MEETVFNKKHLSIGQKVERIRTFRGFKQEYLASKLGVSQQTVSKIEQEEEIEDDLLRQIAEALGVTPEVIKNFDEDKITYIINHQYNIYNNEIKDNATNNFVFNPIEKIAELYERLLTTEREKNELLKNK